LYLPGTYKQKFYVDYTYYVVGAPVLFYVGGEGPLGGSPGGHVSTLAQKLNGLIVALEHRYYGESVPLSIDKTANYAYLTVEQALADASTWATWFQQSFLGNSPSPNVWISIGGSYPGALSAFLREKYPDIFHISWSSSGVVEAIYNFTAFDQVIAKAVGSTCYDAVYAAITAFENVWSDPTAVQNLYKIFNAPADLTREDFGWMISDSIAMSSQYGSKLALCSAMVGSSDPLQSLADWTNSHYGPTFASQCYYNTACLSDPTRVAEWANTKTWIYQCCVEWAFWQVSYPGALRPASVTLDYFKEQCAAAFGAILETNTTAFNMKFGGKSPNSTRVIALNGSDDPWQPACIEQTLNQNYVEFTAVCDGCGHCGDLTAAEKSPAITAQHAAIDGYIMQWVGEAAEEIALKKML
jgi:hypothetical protein